MITQKTVSLYLRFAYLISTIEIAGSFPYLYAKYFMEKKKYIYIYGIYILNIDMAMRPVLQTDRDQSNQCHLYEHQLNDMAYNILK